MRLWKSACQSGESGLCGRGQKAALRRAVRARTQRVNHCLTAPCESPGSGPCCCHTSEGEPTSSRWTPGRWRGFRSGPPSLSWCHPRNKSGRSCPRRCLLTGGSRKGVGGGGGYAACMSQWTEQDEYMCQAWLPIIQVTAKSTAVNYSWRLFCYLIISKAKVRKAVFIRCTCPRHTLVPPSLFPTRASR